MNNSLYTDTAVREGSSETPSSKRIRMGVNVGSSSILLIFVILCLVSFATLSLVSANADSRLSRKVLDRTSDYYRSCNEAEARIADLDHQLQEIYTASSSETDYLKKAEELECAFTIRISDTQSLEVAIEPLYPTQPGDGFYQITTWKVCNTGEYDFDSTLPVFR